MGLKDLFKPKWKHSNAIVRKNAIDKIYDNTLLKQIFLNDLNKDVRLAALDKLHRFPDDEDDGGRKIWSVEYLNFLKNVIIKEKDEEIRYSAIIKINEIIQKYKYSLPKKNRKYNKKAIQDFLIKLVKKDKSNSIREKALENIKDSLLLSEIAQNDADTIIREAAANSITDKNILEELAEKGKYPSVRKIAVEKGLNNNQLLAKIANNDTSKEVRVAAVKFLSDLNLIQNLAQTSIHPEVRSAAESILSEQKILAERAISAPTGERWNVVRDLKDLDVLKKVAAEETNSHVLKLAVEKLIKYVEATTDQKTLVDIAKSDIIEVVRSAAIIKLEDKKLKNSLSISVLQKAVDNFKNEKNYDRRFYLSDTITQCSSEETINFLGEAMRYEAAVYKNYGEYPRERLVKRYEELVGKKFSKKRFKNQYGSNCDDGGLLAALQDWEESHGPKITQKAKWQNYQDKKWGFSFSYPEDWIIISKNISSGSWDVPITIGNKEGTGGPADFIVSVKKVEVLKAYGDNPDIEITNYYDDGTTYTYKRPSTPTEYLERMKEENNIKKKNIISEKEYTITGNPSIELTFYEPKTNKNVISRVITVFGEGITFQFKCQTPSKEFKKFEPVFNDILNTFRIEKRKEE